MRFTNKTDSKLRNGY